MPCPAGLHSPLICVPGQVMGWGVSRLVFTPAVRCRAIWRSGPPGVSYGSQGVPLPTLMPAPAVPNPLDLVSLAPVTHQPVIAILWGHKATTLNPLLDSTGLFFCFFPRLTIDNASFIDLFAATKLKPMICIPRKVVMSISLDFSGALYVTMHHWRSVAAAVSIFTQPIPKCQVSMQLKAAHATCSEQTNAVNEVFLRS